MFEDDFHRVLRERVRKSREKKRNEQGSGSD
jgi:hypothetical protein